MSFKQPVSVLVVIHTAAGQVLLIERAGQAGFWQSVTGSQEQGDADLLHTAVRELQEETGIVAHRSDLCDWHLTNTYEIYPVWRHRYAPGVTHNTEHVMSLCVPQAAPVVLSPQEHTAYQWLGWREAADACFSPSNAEAILLLPRFFKFDGA
jgi:dATP pyrophosphohydrolase